MSQLVTISTSKRHQSLPARLWSQLRSYIVGPISLKDKELSRLMSESRRTVSGIPVNEANAFTFSAVWDAVNQISSDVAKLPLNLHKRIEGGGSKHYVDSKMYRMLKHEPNPEMGSMVFRRSLTAHALTLGNGYAEIERDTLERPIHLWPLTPDRVRPFRDKIRVDGRWRLGALQYEIDGGPTILQAKDVIHIQGLGFDGSVGYNVIDKARQAIGLALAAEQFGGSFFANGATFGGILSAEADLDEDQKNDIRGVIEKLYGAVDKAHRLLVLGAGFKYHKTGVDPNNAQMNETRDKAVEEVARFFNMPLHKLKSLERATNNNIEHQGIEYYTGPMLNWLTGWEEELNRKLISPLESRQQFIKHNAMAFLRGAIKDRFEAYGLFLDRGVFCADDVLELEDMNPQPNGQGKIYLVQGAMVPKHKLIEMIEARIDGLKEKAKPKPAPALPAPAPDAAAQEANDRAQQAEQIAAEARDVAATLRTELETVRATHTATTEELALRRDEVQRSEALAAQLTALSADLQARADAMAAANAALTADVQRQTEAAAAAEERARQVDAERVRCLADAESASELARVARVEAEAAVARAMEAEQTAQSATTGHAGADEARLEAQRAATEALARADAAEAARAEALSVSERATAAADEARVEAERLVAESRATSDAARAEQEREAAARAGAEQAVAAAQLELNQMRAEIATTAAALEAAEAARAEAERLTAETRASAEAAIAEQQREAAARATAEEAVRAAEQELARATTAQQEATAAREASELLVRQSNERATTAEQELQQAMTVAADAERAATAAREVAAQQLAAAQTRASELEAELSAIRSAHHAAEARAAADAAERARLEQALTTANDAITERAASVMSAHRALVVDVMRRMIERETDRARRAQATPEKLRAWMTTFYQGHEELCVNALAPVMRVHLAWMGSTTDPIEFTRSLVLAHVGESIRQLRAVVEGDAAELAQSLNGLLRRWESDRPTAIADRIFQEEIEYARRRT